MSTTKEMFENECYELYKIDWMLRHRYTLTDLVDQLKDNAEMTVDEDGMMSATDGQSARALICSAYTTFEDENGFDGEIWTCKDEFLQSEFLDYGYMMHLFESVDNNKALIDYYEKETINRTEKETEFDTLVKKLEDAGFAVSDASRINKNQLNCRWYKTGFFKNPDRSSRSIPLFIRNIDKSIEFEVKGVERCTYCMDDGSNITFASDVYHGPSFKMLYNRLLKNDHGLKKAVVSKKFHETSSCYIEIIISIGLDKVIPKQKFDTIADAMQYVLENIK